MKINVSGIDSILNKIKSFDTFLTQNMKNVLERLGDIGVEVARNGFNNAIYDGTNDVIVDDVHWVSDTKIEIVATGQAVAFIEFGTGITYTEEHPKARDLGFVRGEYGQGKGKRPNWAYYGESGTNGKIVRVDDNKGNVVLTKGNPPARALYQAGQDIRREVLDIVKGVFLK